MATDSQSEVHIAHHSALEEFRRDERRPALLLLAVLLVAAAFFALGIVVGRWTAADNAARRPHDESVPAVAPSN
jgi:hypothetical protein